MDEQGGGQPMFFNGRTTMKRFWKQAVALAALVSLMALPALALDSKTMRDIERADTSAKLSKLADDLTKDAATRQPKDFEEGTQIATETSAYLLYIITKQNALMMEMYLEDQDPMAEE
jgi:hypothetical protein